MADLNGRKIGFAVCGSFCTFSKAFEQLERLIQYGADVTAVMSQNAASLDTRFGKAADHIAYLEAVTGRKVIRTIEDAEPIGPRKMFDALLIAPCTGNTMAKLAAGIVDTSVVVKRKQFVPKCCSPKSGWKPRIFPVRPMSAVLPKCAWQTSS